ncbi:MAG: sigma-70 family RNA polymerase sigma factor [Planctomycetes bacterium]|nr:sigma-70 family RNA polymerase sigma factor [Planctomycetota bacterium]
MEDSDVVWGGALRDAGGWLRRCRDDWTQRNLDDLTQEAAIAAWRWGSRMRHRERLWAAVQTIARRLRSRSRRRQERSVVVCAQAAVDAAVCEARADAPPLFAVADRALAAEALRPWLRTALRALSPLDQQLLRAFYDGVGCAELAVRHSRTESCVKTRLHRARRRVQHHVEACARAAGGLDDQK